MTQELTKSYFSGRYVRDIIDLCVASLVSGQHSIILGAPGWGKTSVSRSFMEQAVGETGYAFVPVDPSTPPSKIKGIIDPKAYFEESKDSNIVTGTLYDPLVRLGLLDELPRANDLLFDALLNALERHEPRPSVVATGNFMPQNERVEALTDRFALWCWLDAPEINVASILDAQLTSNGRGPSVDPDLIPDWDAIEAVRYGMTAGAKARKAIGDFCRVMVEEADAQAENPANEQIMMRVHPRRLAQWSRLIFKHAAYVTGSADFSTIPDQTKRLLRFAWPAPTREIYAAWGEIAGAVSDPVESAIETAEMEMAQAFKSILDLSDVSQRRDKMTFFGKTINDNVVKLSAQFGDDPRIEEMRKRAMGWWGEAVTA